MRRHAFTLIELLIVVTIIALLIALLMPSMHAAVDASRTTVCRSNLRQITVGHMAYTADHYGIHPPSSKDASEPHWLALIDHYVPIDAIRFCPATDGYIGDPSALAPGASLVGSRTHNWWLGANYYGVVYDGGGSYGVNIFTHSTDAWGDTIPQLYRTESQVTQPAITPLIGDCIWHNSGPTDVDSPPNTEPYGTGAGISSMARYMIRRHQGAINMATMDGATNRVDLEDLWEYAWSVGFKRKSNVQVPY